MAKRLPLSRAFGTLVKSYVRGTDFPPLPEVTVSRQLDITAERFPERLAVGSFVEGKYLTYAKLHEKALRVAGNLFDAGLGRGDRVVVFMPKCVEFYVVQMACALADCIMVPVNCEAGAEELSSRMNLVRAAFLVTSDFEDGQGLLAKVRGLRAAQKGLKAEKQMMNVINTVKRIFVVGHRKTADSDPKEASFEAELCDKDPCLRSANTVKSIIQFQNPKSTTLVSNTSGTTGRSKSVALSHSNLMKNSHNFAQEMGLGPSEKILVTVPLSTTFGLCMGNLAALASGATVYYPSWNSEPGNIVKAVNRFEPTLIIGSAAIYLSMIEELKGTCPLVAVLRGVLGGSIATDSLVKAITDKLRIRNLTVCYGMTETSSVCFMTKAHDSRDRKVNTVGTLLRHLEARVVDGDGFTVDVGQPGELQVKGYSAFHTYYNDQALTRQNLTNGWVRSGDLAVMDSDGYVRIVGHKKHVIVRSGNNVYPEDVEEALLAIPELKEVKAVGVSDAAVGEEVVVFATLRDPTRPFDFNAHAELIAKALSPSQRPRYAIVLPALPKTPTSKVQGFKLQEEFERVARDAGALRAAEVHYPTADSKAAK